MPHKAEDAAQLKFKERGFKMNDRNMQTVSKMTEIEGASHLLQMRRNMLRGSWDKTVFSVCNRCWNRAGCDDHAAH